jgi:heparin binding hemagglutinin HbhA
MPTNTDTRTYADTVLEQGKAAFDEARKPLLAWVGATDLAYDRLRSQLKELPADAQARVKKLQGGVESFDPVQMTAWVRQAVESYASQARQAYDGYREQARERYDTLTHRGELVVRRLRRRPELRAAFERTEKLLNRTEKLVEDAEDQVVLKPASRTTTASTSSSGSSGTARKAPARKAPARKAPPTRS